VDGGRQTRRTGRARRRITVADRPWSPATSGATMQPRPLHRRDDGTGSVELLDEQDAVLTGTVVVLGDLLDREPHRLVEGDRALVHR
jgi:hypothetical protein